MNPLAEQQQGALIAYLLGRESGLAVPKPYERDIYLFDTFVAGTTHVEGIEKIGEKLTEDDKLVFYREPENRYDPQAIRIETVKKEKIGYVPREDNVVFSRLMDAGKALFARVISKEMRGNWLYIEIKIYLHES